MGECHFPKRRSKFNHILCIDGCDQQDGEQETCEDADANHFPSHYFFTPFLLTLIDGASLTDIHFLSRKKWP
jgi:hypothetical protein